MVLPETKSHHISGSLIVGIWNIGEPLYAFAYQISINLQHLKGKQWILPKQ